MTSPLPPIVLIDDDANDRFLLESRLARGGVKNPVVSFAVAASAQHYLTQAFSSGQPSMWPQVLFLDLALGAENGYAVLKWIRQHEAMNGMAVVIISGTVDQEASTKAFELGADRFLVKHPPPDLLADVVANPRRS
jgi:CheY-like chemotaxis protein